MLKIIIIGGVAGGATTAARLRRLDESADITIYERGEHISYANCGLPYYIGNVIEEREKLFVQTPEAFFNRFKVNVKTSTEVIQIDRKNKKVVAKDVKTGTISEDSYDKLVLSPGASPVKPPIPGIDNERIFTLRNVTDTDRIKNFVETGSPKRAVIIGAGFIGLEMAENLHNKGIFVTIVEMASQVMNILDYEMAAEVHQHLKTKNVEFYLNDGVASFKENGENLTVRLGSGKELRTDMVLLSIGVKPETTLAKQADLTIGKLGGIEVNDLLQTNDPDIYALGDVIEFENPITAKKMLIPLAGPANKQGRIVADNIIQGNTRKYKGTIGTGIAKVFDLTVASTGVPEKLLSRENIPYTASITHNSSHAGYYPGAFPLTIKLLFSPRSGKILGAQIVGYDGVDKRIDMIAAVLKQGGTIYDLEEIEHAYAPPFSSAKDPVNIAGFVAENIISEKMKIIHWNKLLELDMSETVLLDVRTKQEFELGTIEGALNIPVDQLRNNLASIPKDKKIIVFCGVGLRAYVALRILEQNGFKNVYNLSGGYKTYQYVTGKQSNEDIFEKDYIGKDDLIYQYQEKKKINNPSDNRTVTVDACGLQCPGPILQLKKSIDKLEVNQELTIKATDPGFYKDVKSWCEVTGHTLLSLENNAGTVEGVIRKNKKSPSPEEEQTAHFNYSKEKTMVVFSDDFDKAIASFIIANGALAMDKKVTVFFTFWGLNIIKKRQKAKTRRDIMAKMFSLMMPGHSKKLKLSKMHMSGLGTSMMRGRMKSKKVDSLETMIETALQNGVNIIACQMSMDMMGVKKEDLLDGVTIGGVASYLEAADRSGHNLFI